MFTIRFIKHGGKGYRSFSTEKYDVNPAFERGDGAPSVEIIMDDDTCEYVGPHDPYDTAFVTNSTGRTIDRIQAD